MRLLEKLTSALEISRRVDLHPDTVDLDQADRDAHSCFEGAQLLETLALFEHAAGQPHKPLERSTPVGVDPDMLVMRSGTPRHDSLAEIERAGRAGRVGKA